MTRGSEQPGTIYHALVRVLEAQSALFGQLDALSQRQALIIAEDDPERLLEILAERQRVIDRIEGARRELEPVRVQWEAQLARMDPAWRKDVGARVDALARLAEGVAKRDDEDRKTLMQRREDVARELAAVTAGGRAAAAYGPRGDGGARFQDREA